MLTFVQYMMTSCGVAMFLFFTAQLTASKLNISRILLLACSVGLITILKAQFEWDSLPFMICNLLAFIAILCILVFAYTEKPLKRCLVFCYFLAVWILSDAIAGAVFSLYWGDAGRLLSELSLYLPCACFGLAINLLIGSISVLLWRMIAARKFQPFYLLFFVLPVGQVITVYSFVFPTWTVYWVVGVLLSLVADLVLLAYTISQEKKTELEEELRETRHMMELEQAHYREVEQRREELAKIRHDFNNQLASVVQLIRSGKEDAAQGLIRALADEIGQTKENPYCGIPVVNAILTEKAQACAAEKIGFVVELDIPLRLSVEPMHLCSIFSNLLDNAIHACKQAPETDQAVIRLSSKIDGDYLFIKTVNPAREPPKKARPGHGYGSRILSDLAARYGGDYQTEYRGGVFSAVVSLLAEGSMMEGS